jgi:hypothetical protein
MITAASGMVAASERSYTFRPSIKGEGPIAPNCNRPGVQRAADADVGPALPHI